MGRKHFAVSIDVYSRTFRLFQQFFEVFQVMPADKDTRIVAYTDIDFGNFGIAVTACIGSIQLCHGRHPMLTCLQCKLNQFFHSYVIAGQFS